MGVGPSPPGADASPDIEGECVGAQWDGAQDFDASEAHQTEVAVASEVGVRGEEFLELSATLVECLDAHDLGKISY